MNDNKYNNDIDEVLDSEADDIWDLFFPYMTEKKEAQVNLTLSVKKPSKRQLKFLNM